jgi:transposase
MDKTDTKIIKLKNDGKSLRQIAKQVGISHVAVKKRLDRLTANKTGNQAPPPDTGQLWDMDEYPELNHAVTEIDGFLVDTRTFF